MDNEFTRLIVRLAVFVIGSDGSVDEPEIRALDHLDTLGFGRISPLAREELKRAAKRPIDLHETCDRLKAAAPHGGPVILAALGKIAASNRSVPTTELWALRLVSRALAVPDDVADEAFAPALKLRGTEEQRTPSTRSPESAPRRVSRDAIVASYRRAIERYNPEKVIHLGPEYAVLAVRRLALATDVFEREVAELRELEHDAEARLGA